MPDTIGGKEEDEKMKKPVIAIILISCLFVACLPTPEEEIVVNKGDSSVQDSSLQSENIDHSEIRSIPQHITKTEQPQNLITVEIDADVDIDRSSVFPVLEVGAMNTVEDPSFCSKILSTLCSGGKVYKRWKRTKEEIQEELVAAMSYHGQAGSLAEIDEEYIEFLEDAYRNAPAEAEQIAYDAAKGFERKSDYYILNTNGTVSILSFGNTINEGAFCDDYRMMYYTEDFLEKEDAPLSDPMLTEEEAIAIATDFLDSLGAECNSVVGTERGFAFSATLFERKDTVWWIHFVRRIGASDSIDMRDVRGYQFPSNPSSVLGAPWEGIESIHIAVGKDGVRYLQWEGLTEVRKILQKDISLYDFDDLIPRAVAQLGYQYTHLDMDDAITVCVQKIALVYGVVSEKDQRGIGIYIPLWEITYQIKEEAEPFVWKMYFSAIDGSTVEPRITTDSLIQESMHQ